MKTGTDLDRIPAELTKRPQWVGFKLQNGDKLPVIADRPDRNAKSDDPNTWQTFDIAAAGLRKGTFPAIAYALDGDFITIDLDDCFKDGKLTGASIDLLGKSYTAKSIIRLCQSYTEWSASGRGLHIVLKGQLPAAPFTNRPGVIEIYGSRRFIIFTGAVIGTGLSMIRSNPKAINKLVAGLGHGDMEDIKDIDDIERQKQVTAPTPILSIIKLSITEAERIQIYSAIDKTVPTRTGQRNSKVFDLVRLLKFDCGLDGRSFAELKPFVKYWHKKALPVIGTKDWDTSWGEFCYGWPRAKSPLCGNLLDLAWRKVCEGASFPANPYTNRKVIKLLNLCYVMHTLSPLKKHKFFFGMSKAAEKLQAHAPDVQAWLTAFISDGFLAIAKKGCRSRRGKRGRATRYYWLGGDVVTTAIKEKDL